MLSEPRQYRLPLQNFNWWQWCAHLSLSIFSSSIILTQAVHFLASDTHSHVRTWASRRKRRKIQQLGCEKRFFGLISPQPESLCLNCWRSEVHRYLGREPGGEKQSHHIPHNVTAVWCALGIFKSEVLQTGIKCANFISAEVVNSAHSESITDTIFAFGWGKLHTH